MGWAPIGHKFKLKSRNYIYAHSFFFPKSKFRCGCKGPEIWLWEVNFDISLIILWLYVEASELFGSFLRDKMTWYSIIFFTKPGLLFFQSLEDVYLFECFGAVVFMMFQLMYDVSHVIKVY